MPGNTGASTKASFFVQLPTEANLEPDVYFSDPIVYEPEDWVYIELYYTAPVGAGGQTFPFHETSATSVGDPDETS